MMYRVVILFLLLCCTVVSAPAQTIPKSLQDLRGKKVHFGSDGAAGTLTGPIIFQRLGIQVQQVDGSMDNPTGMQKVLSGEIDAVVRVTPKPVQYVSSIPASSGLHLVPIPFS